MTRFDKQKLTEVVLYILNKTKGLDYYHVFKIIYFANIAENGGYPPTQNGDIRSLFWLFSLMALQN